MRFTMLFGTIFVVLLTTGCASSPPLHTESSTSAIRAAEEVGAGTVPQAAFHLQSAKEELARAQELATNGKQDQARSLLMRAEADAELAILLSREQAEKSEAIDAMERVRRLQRNNR